MAKQTRSRRASLPSHRKVVELVVNLDDVSPQIIGDSTQRLLAAGALDVWTTAIQMKKQRPGVMLSLLCEPRQRDAMAGLVLTLTGAMGVRYRAWDRLVLDREHVTADTAHGPVRVKVGRLPGAKTIITAQPEFEDVKANADRADVPVRVAARSAAIAADKVARRSR